MKTIYILSFLVLSLGCGGGASTGSGVPGSVASGSGMSCDEAWRAYVAANPEGRQLDYKIENHMNVRGIDRVTLRSSRQERVTESNDNRVVIVRSTPQSSSVDTLIKADFLASCSKGSPTGPQAPIETPIIERGRQTIAVAAGTFDCTYLKTKGQPSGSGGAGEFISEMWMDGDILVKSILTTTSQQGSEKIVTTLITELEKLKR